MRCLPSLALALAAVLWCQPVFADQTWLMVREPHREYFLFRYVDAEEIETRLTELFPNVTLQTDTRLNLIIAEGP